MLSRKLKVWQKKKRDKSTNNYLGTRGEGGWNKREKIHVHVWQKEKTRAQGGLTLT